MFDKIYEAAKESAKANQEKYNKEIKEKENLSENEKIQKADNVNSKWNNIGPEVKREDVHSEELYDIIKNNDFTIVDYFKRIDDVDFHEEYGSVTEYYFLENKNYTFIAKNLSDVDIPEGIFAVYNVIDKMTKEKTDFFVDLGCRNTTEDRLLRFLTLVNSDTIEEYFEKTYSAYKALPELLKKNGYEIKDNMRYEAQIIKGNILVKGTHPLYVIPYVGIMDDIRVVVTNISNWGVNDYNKANEIGYYVKYSKIEDIHVLIDNIESLKKHISGEYGYNQNNRYYNNYDIEKAISLHNKRNEQGELLPAVNFYHVKIEKVQTWDGRGYSDSPFVNVYKGLEIAKHFHFVLNDAAQWTIGDEANLSDVVIKYDKNIDKDNCILLIKNYKYNPCESDIFNYPDEDDDSPDTIDELSYNINQDFLVDSIELHAPYLEIMEKLKEYMNTLCKIYNVDITF